jgi:ABC-2 type transport system permease protein
MNTQSNAVPESVGSQVVTAAATSVTRPLYWSVRRELWENRSIYIAPLAVAAVTLFGYLIATMGYALSTTDMAQRRAALEEPYSFATALIMGAAFVVSVFYSLEALHSERRDRSILFWKSLPVSDLTTVLSKASIPFIVLPLLAFAIVVVTVSIMLLLTTLVLLGSGVSAATAWKPELFRMGLMLLYHLITVHILWYAPFYGWLLLVSAWARRAAFLWAALPPLAICAVEKIAFNTTHFAAMLQERLQGGAEAITVHGTMPFDPMTHLTPVKFLISPGLWIGLVITAGFLVAAVRLRRYQGPI